MIIQESGSWASFLGFYFSDQSGPCSSLGKSKPLSSLMVEVFIRNVQELNTAASHINANDLGSYFILGEEVSVLVTLGHPEDTDQLQLL